MATATYTKLKSGSWGIRVAGTAKKGDRVSVATKAGVTKTETVTAVVWSGNDITICAIDAPKAPAGRGAGYGGGRAVRSDCCGYQCPVTGMKCTSSRPCHDCQ